ncbi:MAG: hypothetical protein E7490_09335 [Ruminococcaceae bacterium]|nr:hypothetical protein [Oscillospiraceae bacterium]
MKRLIQITTTTILLSVLLCSCTDNNYFSDKSDVTNSVISELESTSDGSFDVVSKEWTETFKEEMLNKAYKIKHGDTPERVHEIMGGEPDSIIGSGLYGEVYYISEDKNEFITIQYGDGVVWGVVCHNKVTEENFSIV